MRHVSRWAEHAVDRESFARLCIALLASLEGSIGVYQGEELGQTETELSFEELTDPEGIRFWPDHKGRDGCRTPMVWEAEAAGAGFSAGTPWLPIKAEQAARAVDRQGPDSVLGAYRAILGFRRNTVALRHGRTKILGATDPILMFERRLGEASVTCIFNLGRDAVDLPLGSGAAPTGPFNATFAKGSLHLPGNGFAWVES
jgi:alpha-glucosidase